MSFDINNRRYTGSKQKIVQWIRTILLENCHDCYSFCDLFAGTGVVTNAVINDYKSFFINDFLYSNEVIYNAFFSNKKYSEEKINRIARVYQSLNPEAIEPNYFSINYGGKFFEENDSKIIGYIREDLENKKKSLTKREFEILLTSLIYSFDRCANTVGHYEAYCKKSKLRSAFCYELINPVVYEENDDRAITITRMDSNELARKIKADIVYIDPPYSSRQYSRFYHLIETVVKWDKPNLYGEALKPEPENMSEYCSSRAIDAFRSLISDLKCKYIAVSSNNTYNSKSSSSKNKMELDDIRKVLNLKGKTLEFSIEHQAFNAGKTNLNDHQEILFLTKVGEHNE